MPSPAKESSTVQPTPTPTSERAKLYQQFKAKILINDALDRSLVSNQANKKAAFYRWFNYREGFSEPFVRSMLEHLMPHTHKGVLLDPFSGSGSALFAASAEGWQTKGIELLPVGYFATTMRFIANNVAVHEFRATVANILQIEDFAVYYDANTAIKHIPITRGAFPRQEEEQLIGYISYCKKYVVNKDSQALLLYGSFCILEEISYTRKDGQYLRWDTRSGRSEGKNIFNKGKIYTFREAIANKLRQMVSDLEGSHLRQKPLFGDESFAGTLKTTPELLKGSCLDLLPHMESNSIDAVITSPPYANRYDYTRTYALELVFLGCDEEQIKQYRQPMLSCTVENKSKREMLYAAYQEMGKEISFQIIEGVFSHQNALQEILMILDSYAEQHKLNNPGIARLVRNYFYEMCFVIYELARILKPGGTIVMVNDNVRYAGEEIPVDLILSDMATRFGLTVKRIWTLGRGKGNSSQQMGHHGRTELRTCVYIWEKDKK